MTHISFIYYRFNTYPEELICVGMIMIDEENHKIKFSDSKMKIAKKILTNKHVFTMFSNSMKQLSKSDNINLEAIKKLSIYQNGIIKVDKPSLIQTSLDSFEELFNKRVEIK